MSDNIKKMIATFFYVGQSPFAPGSMASVAGVLLCAALSGHAAWYGVVFAVVTALGFFVSGDMERIVKEKDPSCVVIDEVSGVMIAFFMLPLNWPVILTAFFLFRALDMFKLYPVNKFEEMEGSAGIMLDDIFAGIYTNIVMHLAIRLAGIV